MSVNDKICADPMGTNDNIVEIIKNNCVPTKNSNLNSKVKKLKN